VRAASAGAGLDALRQLKLRNEPVALLLGDQRADVWTKRQAVLVAAQASHPERFVRSVPRVPDMPSAVWINPPHAQDDTSTAGPSSGYGSSQMPSLKLRNSRRCCLTMVDTFRMRSGVRRCLNL
jgi:hypothetical protein